MSFEKGLQERVSLSRRGFLKSSATAAGVAAAAPFASFMSRPASAQRIPFDPGYGPLVDVIDETTGLPLLRLPEGFRCISFGWTGDLLDDGTPTPDDHDGMAIVKASGHDVILVRNHEIRNTNGAFPAKRVYDEVSGGGTTNLKFDLRKEKLDKAWASLSGTANNCAGGPTPWNSWLTCEETLVGPAQGYGRDHGFVFDVPANGSPDGEPLKAMGRFVHEAVAVDPLTGIVYETEDDRPSGLYRFIPEKYGDLEKGGRLQMLAVAGQPQKNLMDFDGSLRETRFEVTWVDIDDPEARNRSVVEQGIANGGAQFSRLEGAWFSNGRLYFTSTDAGAAREGQVWEYDPRTDVLTLVFVSDSTATLSNPDNITVSPRGAILLCEDGGTPVTQRLQGLTLGGQIFPFAENNIVLNGEKNGFVGDFRRREWAGATFDPSGRWLFVNIQTPGVTFAITGPWQNGGL